MGGFGGLRAAAVAAALLWAADAHASGPGALSPWYLDQFGGDRGDLVSFYGGRVGIVMARAPRSMLFASWRLLHRRNVGLTAGEALSVPCCGEGGMDSYEADQTWLKARAAVPGAPPLSELTTGRPGDSYTETPNCFAEAFQLASDTLADRTARYGAASPFVRAWLDAQDAVFAACSKAGIQLPQAPAGAPAWLGFDRAYQQAALALYSGRDDDAASRFADIARQGGSPWRGRGLYLAARAQVRQVLKDNTEAAYARAEAAVGRLAAAPAGTFGQGEVRGLRNVLAFHGRPKAYLAELAARLGGPDLMPDATVDFRDFLDLGAAQPAPPDVLDWIATLRAQLGPKPADPPPPDDLQARRRLALAHAGGRWAATHDPAWLVAALSLANPGEPEAAPLIAAAGQIGEGDPAWLSAQYHSIRLTLAFAPPGDSRRRLDAILARRDLSVSDRNIFRAQRAQVAADLADFLRFALRERLCACLDATAGDDKIVRCVRWRWDVDDIQPTGVFDGEAEKGATGFGEDARAILDRAPLATRLAVSADPALPRALRLDVALTSYGRAVGAQDDRHIDEAARQLVELLPLMAPDLRAVIAAKTGPVKRFAEFLVLAKDPGVRPDLAPNYVRPEGRRIVDFQNHWADWVMVKAPSAASRPPPLAAYQGGGFGAEAPYGDQPGTPDDLTDLSCLSECGRGSAPLRLPDFIDAQQAASERGRLAIYEERFDDKPQPDPPGSVAIWDEMLAWCQAHTADPRVPEALHWLVHVGHFGGSHNHSGRRAFRLLHARYPNSSWAKQTPVYND